MNPDTNQFSTPIDVTFDDKGFLGPSQSHARFGVVVVAATGDDTVLLVKKAYRDGYEFSDQWAFPGGMIRGMSSDKPDLSVEEVIRTSASSRFTAETGLPMSASDLCMGFSSPVVTKYTVKGEQKTTIVLEVGHDFRANPPADLLGTTDSSISDVRLWTPFDAIPMCAPANRIILARRYWNRFDHRERTAILSLVDESFDFCNLAAIECRWPQIRKWF